MDHFYRSKGSSYEKESSEYAGGLKANWDTNLPDHPSGFPERVTFEITKKEAEYLSERLLISCNTPAFWIVFAVSRNSFIISFSSDKASLPPQFACLPPLRLISSQHFNALDRSSFLNASHPSLASWTTLYG